MKKLFVCILSLAIVAAFTACGCTRSTETQNTTPTNNTTTAPTTMPDMIPPIETNIPDPSVDTEMPIYTESTEMTAGTDSTNNTENNK